VRFLVSEEALYGVAYNVLDVKYDPLASQKMIVLYLYRALGWTVLEM